MPETKTDAVKTNLRKCELFLLFFTLVPILTLILNIHLILKLLYIYYTVVVFSFNFSN